VSIRPIRVIRVQKNGEEAFRILVTIQACLEGKTILGKTIKTFLSIKSAIVAKSKNFHAKTQSRKGTAKKSFALRVLCVFASLRALLIFFLAAPVRLRLARVETIVLFLRA